MSQQQKQQIRGIKQKEDNNQSSIVTLAKKLTGKYSIRDNNFIYEDKKDGSLYIYDKYIEEKDSKYFKINFNNNGQLLVQELDSKKEGKISQDQISLITSSDMLRQPVTRLEPRSKTD